MLSGAQIKEEMIAALKNAAETGNVEGFAWQLQVLGRGYLNDAMDKTIQAWNEAKRVGDIESVQSHFKVIHFLMMNFCKDLSDENKHHGLLRIAIKDRLEDVKLILHQEPGMFATRPHNWIKGSEVLKDRAYFTVSCMSYGGSESVFRYIFETYVPYTSHQYGELRKRCFTQAAIGGQVKLMEYLIALPEPESCFDRIDDDCLIDALNKAAHARKIESVKYFLDESICQRFITDENEWKIFYNIFTGYIRHDEAHGDSTEIIQFLLSFKFRTSLEDLLKSIENQEVFAKIEASYTKTGIAIPEVVLRSKLFHQQRLLQEEKEREIKAAEDARLREMHCAERSQGPSMTALMSMQIANCRMSEDAGKTDTEVIMQLMNLVIKGKSKNQP